MSTNGKAVIGIHSAAERQRLCEKWNTTNQAEAQRRERESMKDRVSYSHEFKGDAACRAAALAAVQKKQGEGAGMDRFLWCGERSLVRGDGVANSWVFVFVSPWVLVGRVVRHLVLERRERESRLKACWC